MCNDYAREIEVGRVIKLLTEMEHVPPFAWKGGTTPNDIAPQPHVKISDKGFVAKLDGKHLVGDMVKWAWKTPTRRPVFNFLSEDRDFSHNQRVLILATSFYEYSTPQNAEVKLKDQHQFTMAGEEWFWIAGIVKQGCFAMLTTTPGADVKPYHDRQVCVLKPKAGMDWLQLSRPETELLKALPQGTLEHWQSRKDGVDLRKGGIAEQRGNVRQRLVEYHVVPNGRRWDVDCDGAFTGSYAYDLLTAVGLATAAAQSGQHNGKKVRVCVEEADGRRRKVWP